MSKSLFIARERCRSLDSNTHTKLSQMHAASLHFVTHHDKLLQAKHNGFYPFASLLVEHISFLGFIKLNSSIENQGTWNHDEMKSGVEGVQRDPQSKAALLRFWEHLRLNHPSEKCFPPSWRTWSLTTSQKQQSLKQDSAFENVEANCLGILPESATPIHLPQKSSSPKNKKIRKIQTQTEYTT